MRCPEVTSEAEASVPIRCVAQLRNESNTPVLLNTDLRFVKSQADRSTVMRSVRDAQGAEPPTQRWTSGLPERFTAESFGVLQPTSRVTTKILLLSDYAPLAPGDYRIKVTYVSREPASQADLARLRSQGAWFGPLDADELRLRVTPERKVLDEPISTRCEREWRETLALGLDAPAWADLDREEKYIAISQCDERICALVDWRTEQLIRAAPEQHPQDLRDIAVACATWKLDDSTLRCLLQAADARAFLACAR